MKASKRKVMKGKRKATHGKVTTAKIPGSAKAHGRSVRGVASWLAGKKVKGS